MAIYDKALLGKKVGMTRIFTEDGKAQACTLVEAGPCTVLQRKTEDKEGYEAIQIGFESKREKRTTKPMMGHFKKSGTDPLRFVREVRFTEAGLADAPEVGARLTCEIFEEGEKIDVIGTSKGRGFTGVVKRHNFSTLKESHGAHFFTRHAGSIGSRKPQHTLPGTRMAGQHGNRQTTVQNLRILRVDAAKNLLYVQGAIPGAPNGLVVIRKARKQKKQATS